MTKLSNSRMNMYDECGYKFKLRYIDGIDNDVIYSALHLGGAVDETLNNLLMGARDGKLAPLLDLQDEFEQHYRFIDGEDISASERQDFYKKEFRPDLLSLQDLLDLADKYKVAVEELTWDKQRAGYNEVCWRSNLVIGKAIIKTYYEDILPKLTEEFEIVDVQEKLEVTNEDNDLFTAIIDFTAKSKADGKMYIMDNKTASDIKKQYKKGCVEESQQLSLYAEFKQFDRGGYVAIEKKVLPSGKCPFTIVVGDILPITKELVFNKFEGILTKIRQNVFEKNERGCYSFGRKCIYWNLCKKGDITGLHKKE